MSLLPSLNAQTIWRGEEQIVEVDSGRKLIQRMIGHRDVGALRDIEIGEAEKSKAKQSRNKDRTTSEIWL